jgi:membrane-associated phospholipid phosphatase
VNKQIVLMHADATKLPFKINSKFKGFDGVWTVQTFQHIPNYEKAVREAYRVLKKKGVFILSTFLISSLLAQLLKNFVFDDFMSPYHYIQSGALHVPIVSGIKMHASHSFPSGHTTTIFALTAAFSLFYQSKKIGASLFVIAFFVGFSRIYLSQHFLEDTLAGSILGVTTSFVIHPILMKNRSFIK